MAGLHTVAYRGGWVVEMGVGVAFCQVREIYGGNSGNSGRQVQTYEMSEGTSASAYVLRPFQTLVPRFRNGEIGDRRSKDRSKDRS